MNGRIVVLVILILALVSATGAITYRLVSRPGLVLELKEPARRQRALQRLLRMNNLWGHAQDTFCDFREASPGSAYLETRPSPEGKRHHVVRAVRAPQGAASTPAAIVIDDRGVVVEIVEGAVPLLLDGAEDGGAVALAAPTAGTEGSTSIYLAGNREEALRVRGRFLLQLAGGRAHSFGGAPEPGTPLFVFDAATGTFSGPPGGHAQPWLVDAAASKRFVPRAQAPLPDR